MRWHEGVVKHKCNVPNCWMAFATNQHLQQHLRIHTRQKPFECGICKMRFSQSGNLNVHKKIHTQNVSLIEESEFSIS
jgi:uncharacterized Zn-finger protein